MSLSDRATDRDSELNPHARVKWLSELLERQGIDVRDVGRVEKINAWQGFYKDGEGDAQKVDMVGLSFSPAWQEDPTLPVIDRAPRAVLLDESPVKARPKGKKQLAKRWKTAVILPDQQIGYRRYEEGELEPFHDEAAMGVALEILKTLQDDGGVDQVGNLGDVLDLARLSRHPQEPYFALTVQPSLDRAGMHLAEQRAICPTADVWMLEGNHDRRIQTAVTNYLMEVAHLRRANAPESWPVLSVQYLLRLEELGIEYIGGYPAGEKWITDSLVAFHGRKVRSSGSSAAATAYDENVSSLFGHVHRIEAQYRTVRDRSGGRRLFAATPGCLCRIDGAVPSVKGSTDVKGRHIESVENWQQGIAVVTYEEQTGKHFLELVEISEGGAVFRGQAFGTAAA